MTLDWLPWSAIALYFLGGVAVAFTLFVAIDLLDRWLHRDEGRW